MGRSHHILLSFLILLTAVATVSQAEIPQVISYQGKVTDASGTPVADGSYTMRFRIHDAASAGTLLWDSGAQSVTVAGGIFSVLLGESPQPAITLDFNADYWLLVTFAGVDQTPRQRLASTGYAYMASGLVAGTEVSGDVSNGPFSAIKGTNTATSGTTYGVYGESASTSGRGVFGTASATSGTTYGVEGRSYSTTGLGVFGTATATSGYAVGVYGESASTGGRGVQGVATATSGATYGVRGVSYSTAGRGVFGLAATTSGTTYGVRGQTDSSAGGGVYGDATATSGTTYGVLGQSASTAGRGVYGEATATTGTTYGGYFESASTGGQGVQGYASATSGTTYGVRGVTDSSAGYGVYGDATATVGYTYGAYGQSSSTSGRGVYGLADATSGLTYGVYGQSSSPAGMGVFGLAMATTGLTYGVYGQSSSTSGYGGYFSGRLRATASINATGTPDNHVALLHNASTGTSPDVLCLKVGYTGNPGSAINYLTFVNGLDTGIGAVEGDGAGGVTFLSGGSDYAEYLPRREGEAMEPGDVVGVFEGEVTKRTEGASQVMVVSTRPIVLGNNPGEDKSDDYARVAFIGQVEVKVRGPVEAGDLLLPSGMGDGVAAAVSRDGISAEQFRQVFGQAWEGSTDGGVKRIRAAVGLLQHDPSVARLEAENRAVREAVEALHAANAEMQASIGVLRDRVETLEAAR